MLRELSSHSVLCQGLHLDKEKEVERRHGPQGSHNFQRKMSAVCLRDWGSLESLKVWPESLPGDPHMEPFSSVQLLSHVQFFATPWITASQTSLSITNSRGLLKLHHRVGDAIQLSHPLSSPSPPDPIPTSIRWSLFIHSIFNYLVVSSLGLLQIICSEYSYRCLMLLLCT